MLTEPWLEEKIMDSDFDLKEYSKYRCDRSISREGGVLVAVHNSTLSTIISTYHDDYIIFQLVHIDYHNSHINRINELTKKK